MNKKGFTLIELLIVVVIIGILAAIAIPRFSQTRERAFVSSMQSDLRNLQTIQEQFYADPANDYEYGSLADITGASLFAASTGVDVAITGNDQGGWAATATHSGFAQAGPHCAIAVGTADNALFAGAASGQVVCDIEGVIAPPAAAGEGAGEV